MTVFTMLWCVSAVKLKLLLFIKNKKRYNNILNVMLGMIGKHSLKINPTVYVSW